MPDITYDVGRVSFVMKGAWNLATSYEKLDAVSYNGSLYIAKQDVPGGTAITNTTYWQLAAEKGDKGDTGGVDSVNGQQGDVWFPDSRQLISDGYTTDTGPFLTKGNDSDSDRFELAKKLGNTVGVNQLLHNPDFADTSYWNPMYGTIAASGNKLTYTRTTVSSSARIQQGITLPKGHKTYFRITVTPSRNATIGIALNVGATQNLLIQNIPANVRTTLQVIAEPNNDATILYFYNDLSGEGQIGDTVIYEDAKMSDQALWYGSNDAIPSDLLAHPENWGRYYAGSLDYEPGRLESADGSILTSIHRNIWDEEWEVGGYYTSNGAPSSETDRIRTKNYIEVIPNTSYYAYDPTNGNNLNVLFYDANKAFISATGWHMGIFNTPANCRFIHFYTSGAYGNTYNHDITISLYYSGEPGYDQYYPYSVLAEVDTGSEVLRGVEGSRDEKLPNGTITRNRAVIDLGTMNWGYTTSYGRGVFYADLAGRKVYNTTTTPEFICPLYVADNSGGPSALASKGNMLIAATITATQILITNDSYSDAASFKTAMSGVMLEYPLATPTTEQGTAFDPLVVTVKNGVLSWTNTKGIPVGQESHWFENLRKRVEDRLPDPPSADGTYRLTCTISGGVKTYSWEA